MNNIGRNIAFWAMIIVGLMIMMNAFQGLNPNAAAGAEKITYSEFMTQASDGRISNVTIQGDKLTGNFASSSEQFTTMVPPYENVVDRLSGSGVQISAEELEPRGFSIFDILFQFAPILLLIGFWFFMLKQMGGKGGGGGAMGFGKSKAKLLSETMDTVTFEDVAGIDEAKQELEEIVDFLKDPTKFQKLGGKIPKGALLIGSPGTGKTLIARAVAGEAGVPFFSISGSDFVEMFVGVGASRMRDMFEQGKKNAPCIIFIDEIDAVGRTRGGGWGGGNDEREQTLNQMLVEMDGFDAHSGVIILAATNRPDVLDPALLRPGRFDRQITVPLPDVHGREKILAVHIKNVPTAGNVDLATLAKGTPGFSGAELANLINEAALMAARHNKRVVSMSDFEQAKDKVMMGAERRSLAMSEDEKKLTAYHEAGHAIVALNEKESDPIHKATIVPRGRALGMVMRLPEGDRYTTPVAKLKANLSVAMGGRVAEEIIFGADQVTTGASGDIQQATAMARQMVTSWGMSEKIGMIDYADSPAGYQPKQISTETAATIESEVRALVDEGYVRAKDILTKKKKDLKKLAEGLLEYESLSGDDITALLKGKYKPADDTKSTKNAPSTRSTIPVAGGKDS